ncbi:uncharacterized protein EV422DRAFT_267831 [Fimicolochytrium jonesii]|uniref:uncharacterized protein n=1 Tax=Fimicolochytrium jonesii TaxID=1396493 RepID=UPI0022FEB69F|nr:uncharacterized protein EV422DRAFT_267831 [Fimicolochytrium jonesii]KAI8816974.1 hypothetical protein EV422DRAFT_267831 [Fimicolochytrium jonesii]
MAGQQQLPNHYSMQYGTDNGGSGQRFYSSTGPAVQHSNTTTTTTNHPPRDDPLSDVLYSTLHTVHSNVMAGTGLPTAQLDTLLSVVHEYRKAKDSERAATENELRLREMDLQLEMLRATARADAGMSMLAPTPEGAGLDMGMGYVGFLGEQGANQHLGEGMHQQPRQEMHQNSQYQSLWSPAPQQPQPQAPPFYHGNQTAMFQHSLSLGAYELPPVVPSHAEVAGSLPDHYHVSHQQHQQQQSRQQLRTEMPASPQHPSPMSASSTFTSALAATPPSAHFDGEAEGLYNWQTQSMQAHMQPQPQMQMHKHINVPPFHPDPQLYEQQEQQRQAQQRQQQKQQQEQQQERHDLQRDSAGLYWNGSMDVGAQIDVHRRQGPANVFESMDVTSQPPMHTNDDRVGGTGQVEGFSANHDPNGIHMGDVGPLCLSSPTSSIPSVPTPLTSHNLPAMEQPALPASPINTSSAYKPSMPEPQRSEPIQPITTLASGRGAITNSRYRRRKRKTDLVTGNCQVCKAHIVMFQLHCVDDCTLGSHTVNVTCASCTGQAASALNGTSEGRVPNTIGLPPSSAVSNTTTTTAASKRRKRKMTEHHSVCLTQDMLCMLCKTVIGVGGLQFESPTGTGSSSSSSPSLSPHAAYASPNGVSSSTLSKPRSTTTGGIKNPALPPIMVEIICAPCYRTYAFCSDCGGGGTFRTGKYRPRQLFEPGRATCSLSHVRLTPGNVEEKVFRIPLINDDPTLDPAYFTTESNRPPDDTTPLLTPEIAALMHASLPYMYLHEVGNPRFMTSGGPEFATWEKLLDRITTLRALIELLCKGVNPKDQPPPKRNCVRRFLSLRWVNRAHPADLVVPEGENELEAERYYGADNTREDEDGDYEDEGGKEQTANANGLFRLPDPRRPTAAPPTPSQQPPQATTTLRDPSSDPRLVFTFSIIEWRTDTGFVRNCASFGGADRKPSVWNPMLGGLNAMLRDCAYLSRTSSLIRPPCYIYTNARRFGYSAPTLAVTSTHSPAATTSSDQRTITIPPPSPNPKPRSFYLTKHGFTLLEELDDTHPAKQVWDPTSVSAAFRDPKSFAVWCAEVGEVVRLLGLTRGVGE